MRNDLIRLMQTMFLPSAKAVHDVCWHPAVDIYRTSQGWLLKFDLAGVSPKDIDVTVEGSRLTVRGVRRDWRHEEICSCYQMEITYSRFERMIELPESIQSAPIEATNRDGMLLVRIQREENA